MLYVLDQRLIAQNITPAKSDKVLCDITNAMFNLESYKQMAKSQMLYSKDAFKVIFKKIVHSSIMKIHADSMEKLYDLMVMSVKYQVMNCNHPKELLHVTLNHLDAAMSFIARHSAIVDNVRFIYSKMIDSYANLSMGEYIMVKHALLCFLQNSNNKVSIYLAAGLQNEEGRFVIPKSGEMPEHYDVPGTITVYRPEKSEKVTTSFETGCKFYACASPYYASNFSDEIKGKRCTKLGTNIYCNEGNFNTFDVEQHGARLSSGSNRYAQAELGLLSQMFGTEKKDDKSFEFKLSLFSSSDVLTPEKPSKSVNTTPEQHNVVNITAEKNLTEELTRIAEEMTITPTSPLQSRGEDFLSLMDS